VSYTVQVTDTASCDLKKIAVDIATSACDISVGLDFVERIRDRLGTLSDYPYAGSLPQDDELRTHGYRFLIYDDYLVFYTVNESDRTVYIVAAFNAKADYTRVMRNFMRKKPI